MRVQCPGEPLRRNGTPCNELDLDGPNVSDDALIDRVIAHAILFDRPIGVMPKGCRRADSRNWSSAFAPTSARGRAAIVRGEGIPEIE